MATYPIPNTKRFIEATLFLKQRIEYDGSGNAIYLGYAAPGSAESDEAWLIVKNAYDGSDRLTASGFADGSIGFDKQWQRRTAYDYGL